MKYTINEIKTWWKFNRLPVTCRECHLSADCRAEDKMWKFSRDFGCWLSFQDKVIDTKPTLRSLIPIRYFYHKVEDLNKYPHPALNVIMTREINRPIDVMDTDLIEDCLDILVPKEN